MSSPFDRLLGDEELVEQAALAEAVVTAHAVGEWPPPDVADLLLTFAHAVLALCRHVAAEEEIGALAKVERWQ